LCRAPLCGHGAERRNYSAECYVFTEDRKNAALRFVTRKKCADPLHETSFSLKKCGAPLCDTEKMQQSASCLGGMCFLHRNCGIPVCKYSAERRIISKIGDEFYYRVEDV